MTIRFLRRFGTCPALVLLTTLAGCTTAISGTGSVSMCAKYSIPQCQEYQYIQPVKAAQLLHFDPDTEANMICSLFPMGQLTDIMHGPFYRYTTTDDPLQCVIASAYPTREVATGNAVQPQQFTLRVNVPPYPEQSYQNVEGNVPTTIIGLPSWYSSLGSPTSEIRDEYVISIGPPDRGNATVR